MLPVAFDPLCQFTELPAWAVIIIIIIIINNSSSCCYNHLLCIAFTTICLKQAMVLGYIVLQLFCSCRVIIIIIIVVVVRITVAFQIPPFSRAKTAEIQIFYSVPYFSKQGNVCK
jgi:hypothetical protein